MLHTKQPAHIKKKTFCIAYSFPERYSEIFKSISVRFTYKCVQTHHLDVNAISVFIFAFCSASCIVLHFIQFSATQ